MGLEETLEWTVSWYAAHRAGIDGRRLTEMQISQYENLPVHAPARADRAVGDPW